MSNLSIYFLGVTLSLSDFTGNATETSGEIQVNRNNVIKSIKTYSRPISVEAEMKSVGYSECISLSLFAASDFKNDNLNLTKEDFDTMDEDEIKYLDMTFEEASKFIVSAGTSNTK